MKLTKTQIILIGLVVFLVVVFIGVLVFFGRRAPKTAGYAGTLTVWGVFDRADVFEKLVEGYRKLQPGVEINYVQKDPATYEDELINALATPKGPDVFMFHNTWLPKRAGDPLTVTGAVGGDADRAGDAVDLHHRSIQDRISDSCDSGLRSGRLDLCRSSLYRYASPIL